MNLKTFIFTIFASAAAQDLGDSWPDNWPNVVETGLRENPARFMPMVRPVPVRRRPVPLMGSLTKFSVEKAILDKCKSRNI